MTSSGGYTPGQLPEIVTSTRFICQVSGAILMSALLQSSILTSGRIHITKFENVKILCKLQVMLGMKCMPLDKLQISDLRCQITSSRILLMRPNFHWKIKAGL